jgi:hypothetical protein
MVKEMTILMDRVVACFEDISREVLGKMRSLIDLPGELKPESVFDGVVRDLEPFASIMASCRWPHVNILRYLLRMSFWTKLLSPLCWSALIMDH